MFDLFLTCFALCLAPFALHCFFSSQTHGIKHILVLCGLLFIAFLLLPPPLQADNGNLFSGQDAIGLVTEALIAREAGRDIKVNLNEFHAEDILANSAQPLTGTMEDMTIEKSSGHWNGILVLQEGGRNLSPVKLSGTYDEMVGIPILKHGMKAGEVIRQEDVELDRQPLKRLHKNIITDAGELAGKSAKRSISAGRPIRTDEITRLSIITKGTHITLLYKTPHIEIKTVGEAMDNGAKGDMIRIRNLTSKQVIEGRVESGEMARVTSFENSQALLEEQ